MSIESKTTTEKRPVEESEIRIINFLLGVGIIFSVVICPLLFLNFQRTFESTLEDKSTVPKELQLNFLEPKLMFLDIRTGMINTFAWKNQTLTKEWDKRLPFSMDYFPYFDNGFLNIIYGDEAKDMTFIDVKNQKNCHRVLQTGKLKHHHQIDSSNFFQLHSENYIDMQSLRVGNHLIWFGGRQKHYCWDTLYLPCIYHDKNYQILLWNMKRRKWYKGMNLPSGIYGHKEQTWEYTSTGFSPRHMCGVGVNDTTAVLFGMKVAHNISKPHGWIDAIERQDTLTKFTLDLMSRKWVEIDTKFHSFGDDFPPNLIFACDSTISKTSEV